MQHIKQSQIGILRDESYNNTPVTIHSWIYIVDKKTSKLESTAMKKEKKDKSNLQNKESRVNYEKISRCIIYVQIEPVKEMVDWRGCHKTFWEINGNFF